MPFSDNSMLNWLLGIAATLGSMLVSAWGYIFFRNVKKVEDMQLSKVDRDHFDDKIESLRILILDHRVHIDHRIDKVESKFDEEHRITRHDITELVKAMMSKKE